jgi:hypothetical protein
MPGFLNVEFKKVIDKNNQGVRFEATKFRLIGNFLNFRTTRVFIPNSAKRTGPEHSPYSDLRALLLNPHFAACESFRELSKHTNISFNNEGQDVCIRIRDIAVELVFETLGLEEVEPSQNRDYNILTVDMDHTLASSIELPSNPAPFHTVKHFKIEGDEVALSIKVRPPSGSQIIPDDLEDLLASMANEIATPSNELELRSTLTLRQPPVFARKPCVLL